MVSVQVVLCIPQVPSPSNKYRDRVCKNIQITGFHSTILNFSELVPDIYLTEQISTENTRITSPVAKQRFEAAASTLAVGHVVSFAVHRDV